MQNVTQEARVASEDAKSVDSLRYSRQKYYINNYETKRKVNFQIECVKVAATEIELLCKECKDTRAEKHSCRVLRT